MRCTAVSVVATATTNNITKIILSFSNCIGAFGKVEERLLFLATISHKL